MFGNGQVKTYGTGKNDYIMKTEQFTATATELPTEGKSVSGWSNVFTGPDGKTYKKVNPKFYDAKGKSMTGQTLDIGQKYFCSYDLKATGAVIEISANSFPGTYYAVGDTYARNEVTGEDEFFQFIIPKAKVQSENTITLEAEGDPSVFNMNLRVMRPADGVMMKLVKYNLDEGKETTEANTADLVHNHKLTPETPETIAEG